MNKRLLKGLYAFLLVSIALFAVILITAEAKEMGNYCWEVTHPAFDSGKPHVLILQATQNGWIYLLHGADNTSIVPVHGSAYNSPALNRVVFGVSTPYASSMSVTSTSATSTPAYLTTYSLGADLNPSTLSSDSGVLSIARIISGSSTPMFLTNVHVTKKPCPPLQ